MSKEKFTGPIGMKKLIELIRDLFKKKQDLMEELNLTRAQLEELWNGGEEMDTTALETKLDTLNTTIAETNGQIVSLLEQLVASERWDDVVDGLTAINSSLNGLGSTGEPEEDVSGLIEPLEYTYTLDDENRIITLTKYNGNAETVTVQNKYVVDGKAYTTEINRSADSGFFQGNKSIKSILFEDGIKINSLKGMFSGCSNLTSITWNQNEDSPNVDATECTDLSYTFSGCNKLTSFGVNKLDLGTITDTSYMYAYCTNLKQSYLKQPFDTSAVTNMSGMFKATGLTMVNDYSDTVALDISSCTDMSFMFADCTNLGTVWLYAWDTHNVTNMFHMFAGCTKLDEVRVATGKWQSATANYDMFVDAKISDVTYKTV